MKTTIALVMVLLVSALVAGCGSSSGNAPCSAAAGKGCVTLSTGH